MMEVRIETMMEIRIEGMKEGVVFVWEVAVRKP